MKACKTISLFFFLILINSGAFASNDFIPGMARLKLGDFKIFSGKNSDRERVAASGFSSPDFRPYSGEKLANNEMDDNYHVLAASFTIAGDFADKHLTLYISRFDMPVIIHVNGTMIYRKGLRLETDNAYSTGEPAATDVPLAAGLINFDSENFIVIEVFPRYETSSLPELSIAEYRSNVTKVFFKNLLNVYLVLGAQFLAFFVSIYHFVVFVSRGRKDTKYLIFAFFSLSFVLAYANIGFSYDSKHYTELVKITRSCQLLSLGFYLMFIIESVGLFAKKKKYIMPALAVYGFACAAYIILQKDKHAVNIAFSLMSSINLIPVLLLCIIIPVVAIIAKKNYTVIPLLFTTLIVAAASLRDMLMLNAAAQPLFWYAPYAFLLIIIVIYAILVMEESNLFKNFKRYVPADLVIQLINQDIKPELGGEQQELTVFFSDISKFTSIAEKMEPERMIRDLCDYFESISKTILANKGTIDKYMGDAVMAFWGAPVAMEDHAQRACSAAITVQSNLRKLFSQWGNQGKVPFLTRIGIHTGNVIVGNFGYKDRLNYTVVGDSVNVSSRLEGINKVYGTEIIVSENVYNKCPDNFEFRHLDRVSLLGRDQGTNIYELIAFKDNIDKTHKEIKEYYQQGLQHYFDQNWPEALKYFGMLVENHPNDAPGRLMQQRCLMYKNEPPPKEWSGVFMQTIK